MRNCFGNPQNESDVISIINGILVILLVLLILFENVVVLVLLWRCRALQTPTNVFIACMSIADIFVALLPLPLYFAFYVSPSSTTWQPLLSPSWRLTYFIADNVSSTVSITSLSILAFDQYFIIVHPYVYQRRMTVNIARTISMTIAMYGLLVGVLGKILTENAFAFFIMIAVYAVPSSTIFFYHINVAIIAKRHAKNILKLQVTKSPVRSIKRKYSVLRKISRGNFGGATNQQITAAPSRKPSFVAGKGNLTVNSEIELDFCSTNSAASHSKSKRSRSPSSQSPSKDVQLCDISKPELNKVRLRVSVGYSQVVFEKDLSHQQNVDTKNKYTMETEISVESSATGEFRSDNIDEEENTKQTEQTDDSSPSVKSEDAKEVSKLRQVEEKKLDINEEKEKLKKIEDSNRSVKRDDFKKDSKEFNIFDDSQSEESRIENSMHDNITRNKRMIRKLGHSKSSPQLSKNKTKPTDHNLKHSPSLPQVTVTRSATVRSFRNLVKRNMDTNRQKSIIRDEVLKIVQQIRRLRIELKATILLTVVMVIFLCLWTPYGYVNWLLLTEELDCTKTTHSQLTKYFKLLHYLNAAVNPVYYVLLNSKLRNACKTLFTSSRLRNKCNRKIQPITDT